MDNSEIFDVLHDYVEMVTGLPGSDIRITRPDYGVKPTRDRGTIVTIGLINPTPIGMDAVFYEDIEGDNLNMTEVISADRNITASIKAYGCDASNVINKISFGLKRSSAQEMFYNGRIGFLSQGQVLTLSEVLNGSYEEIRQLDVEFHVNHNIDLTINAIDSATITTEIQNGSLKQNGTIEVQP